MRTRRAEGWTVAEIAEAAGVSVRTVYKWLARASADNRSSRALRPANRLADGVIAEIARLRRERFTQTLLRESVYARPYTSSARRNAAVQPFLARYNARRPHASLTRRTSAEALALKRCTTPQKRHLATLPRHDYTIQSFAEMGCKSAPRRKI